MCFGSSQERTVVFGMLRKILEKVALELILRKFLERRMERGGWEEAW